MAADKRKSKSIDKRCSAFSIFGPATAGDFVSHMVYSMTNYWMIHKFLKGKNISKDVKECFEYKIKDKEEK